MDFECSKENILPLAGGRNAQQLSMALQAQTNYESQQELLQQKEHYEEQIRSYTGDDPLENYYKYISWIEQTYPKHGHEGNFIPLLEECLTLFQDDKRYTNSRRFCKLWIKYNDMQSNPLELYQLMKSKGLCLGCADLYKAWAFYYEAVGDFPAASKVFEEGKKNLAQPYEELEIAHQNLMFAYGQHMLYGSNEKQLQEKRHALISLKTYGGGQVSSIRVGSTNGVVNVPSNSSTTSRSNAVIHVHEDQAGATASSFEVAPANLILAAKRHEVQKENTLTARPWSGPAPMKKRVIGSGSVATGFTVHEDLTDSSTSLRLPKNFATKSLEDYSDWTVSVISCPDPLNPNTIPQYPKNHVYRDSGTEYSIEEIRSRRYRNKVKSSHEIENIDDDDDVQFVKETNLEMNYDNHSILTEREEIPTTHSSNQQISHGSFQTNSQNKSLQTESKLQQISSAQHRFLSTPVQQHNSLTNQYKTSPFRNQPSSIQHQPSANHYQLASLSRNGSTQLSPMKNQTSSIQNQPPMQHHPSSMQHHSPSMQHHSPSMQHQSPSMQKQLSRNGTIVKQEPVQPMQVSPIQYQLPLGTQEVSPLKMDTSQNKSNALDWSQDSFQIWSHSTQNVAPFGIFEESLVENQPKGSAMKTALKDLNADELAETGSRGGMDVAVTAQADDSAKRIPVFSENVEINLDESITTNVFYMNAMTVSTPDNKRPAPSVVPQEETNLSKRSLFTKPTPKEKELSTIFEETKSSYGSRSSSSSSSVKLLQFSRTNPLNMISEEHNSYLEQNLMANAELRSSLLGNLMGTSPVSAVESNRSISEPNSSFQNTIIDNSLRQIPPPANVVPLNFVPSDPFKSQLINQLLERVAFPGPHTYGYVEVPFIVRLVIKKEPVCIGRDTYIIEKQLGKGSFGTVFRAVDIVNRVTVAMKHQKPANKWEYYICRELQSRLNKHALKDRFMDIHFGYFCDQSSVLISQYMPGGSLLDLANQHKQKLGKTMKECLVVYFCIQMLQIVEAMHQVQIIHADIKPDNFLVFVTPENTVGLQLIDFGCSIDMSLFPPHASFRRRVTTEDFVCCEMLDGRSWDYHTDLFCIAATAHVLLFDTYIKLQKKDNFWSIQQRFPRYLKIDLWNMFFSNLLNQQAGPADSSSIISHLEGGLEVLNKDTSSSLPSQMRYIVNLLKNR